MRKFPSGKYGRQRLEFFPAPYKPQLRAFAALVFPWDGEQILLCNIEDRGWCIPSGRVEPFEDPIDAARREAVEEAGAMLSELQYLGCYRITERNEVRWAAVFVAAVEGLVDIGCPEESLGRQLVGLPELPEVYHQWNPLLESVFNYSLEVLQRHMRLTG
mgnify:CR=1 FL=1